MYIEDIIWLPDIVDKLGWKHNVVPEEVDETLFSNPLFRKVQWGHQPGEDVYALLVKPIQADTLSFSSYTRNLKKH